MEPPPNPRSRPAPPRPLSRTETAPPTFPPFPQLSYDFHPPLFSGLTAPSLSHQPHPPNSGVVLHTSFSRPIHLERSHTFPTTIRRTIHLTPERPDVVTDRVWELGMGWRSPASEECGGFRFDRSREGEDGTSGEGIDSFMERGKKRRRKRKRIKHAETSVAAQEEAEGAKRKKCKTEEHMHDTGMEDDSVDGPKDVKTEERV